MQVVFEELEPGPPPDSGRRVLARWLPVALAVAVVGVVVLVATHGGTGRPVAAPTGPPPSVAASGFTPAEQNLPVITLDTYSLPGVMSVAGRTGWQLDAAGSSADVRRYTAADLATGTLRPIVSFGIADRSPAPTIEGEADRITAGLTDSGATGIRQVLAAFEDTMAADLTYTAGGRYVMERLWIHDGTLLFVSIDDSADHVEAVSTLFYDTVVYGVITP